MQHGFALTIRSERKRLGMSLSAFSQRVGTSTASLKRWEAGTSIPSLAQREVILEAIHKGERPAYEAWQCHPGWWLRVARHRRCLSIRTAAQLTDTSPSAWHRYESGHRPIGKGQAAQLANLLGEPLDRFHLGHAYSPDESLIQAEPLVATNPGVACAILIDLLLGLNSASAGVTETDLLDYRTRAHLLLGKAVMHMGDHDLSGQIAKAVLRIGLPKDTTDPMVAEIKAGCVWIGFPNIKESHHAARRLNWLDRQLAQCSDDTRVEFSLTRAMFADWAGHPDLALRILDDYPTLDCLDRCKFSKLARAWVYAKHGQVNRAFSLCESILDDENPKMAFLAHKVALESNYQQSEFRKADIHYRRLEKFRQDSGLWAPDLLARGRRIAEENQPRS